MHFTIYIVNVIIHMPILPRPIQNIKYYSSKLILFGYYASYVRFYGLNGPSDNILEVLLHIAKSKTIVKQMKGYDSSTKKVYDIDAAGHMMVKHFFDGRLGTAMLDEDILSRESDEPVHQANTL